LDDALGRLRRLLPARPAHGTLASHLWELVDHNGDQVALDVWLSGPTRSRRDDVPLSLVGPSDRLWIDPTARIEPQVGADVSGGPVVIDRGAVVTAFTRLEGPCYVGPGSHPPG